ncbi:hypothetical protein BLNAU_19105 [Blattamonas nauphoetae]|uniref:Uncharacterized protein n=1 Tax=Blattamonas nauphoetae TaxID=2049346 RepID=A0ABQ9X2G0_9EUKA|nr:hypothetical protein BLNAU_19105 [Blattamonas nauphoetae]
MTSHGQKFTGTQQCVGKGYNKRSHNQVERLVELHRELNRDEEERKVTFSSQILQDLSKERNQSVLTGGTDYTHHISSSRKRRHFVMAAIGCASQGTSAGTHLVDWLSLLHTHEATGGKTFSTFPCTIGFATPANIITIPIELFDSGFSIFSSGKPALHNLHSA